MDESGEALPILAGAFTDGDSERQKFATSMAGLG
jgi:hypothetical protein